MSALRSLDPSSRDAPDQAKSGSAAQDLRMLPSALLLAQEVGTRLGERALLLGCLPQARAGRAIGSSSAYSKRQAFELLMHSLQSTARA